MFVKPKRKNCRCPNCNGKCAEFQKVMDIKEFGLTLYRYVRRSCNDEEAEDTKTVEPYDIFILHSTNVKEILASDYAPAFDWKRIKCIRCREKAKKAQKLFQNVQSIRAKELRGICDHCFSKQGHDCCLNCQKTIKKFITSKRIDTALSKDVKSPKIRFRSQSLTMMDKITRQSVPMQRDIKVEEMFQANMENTDAYLYDSTDSSVSDSQGMLKRSSIQMDTVKKDVKFGPVSEIKKSILETIAEMDDGSILMLIRHIMNALKEKQDEDGVQIPNASFVAEKSDEELEHLVLEMFKSGNHDMEIQTLELIDAQRTANSHFLEVTNRLKQLNFKAEDIDTPETKFTVSDSKIRVPQTQTIKARGSLEKVIHQEVEIEETRIKNKARTVASLIRKDQLHNYLKKAYNVKPTDRAMEDKDRTLNLMILLKKKLQRGKSDALENKNYQPFVAHKLFRQESQLAVDRDIVLDKNIVDKTPPNLNLKPILKGAKIKKKSFLDTSEIYRPLHPLYQKSKFQYDFFQESDVQLKPILTSSAELIAEIKQRNEELKKVAKKQDHKLSQTLPKKPTRAKAKEQVEAKKTSSRTDVDDAKITKSTAKIHKMDKKSQLFQTKSISKSKDETEQKYIKPRKIEENLSHRDKVEQIGLEKKKHKVTKLRDKKDIDIHHITKQLEKVLINQDKDKRTNLKRKENLHLKEKKYRSQADKALEVNLEDHLPSITVPEKKKIPAGVVTKESTGEHFVEMPFKKIRLRGPSYDDLILKLVDSRQKNKDPRKHETAKHSLIQEILDKRQAKRKNLNEVIESYSDYELDLESLIAKTLDEDGGMIVGNEIFNPTQTIKYISTKEKETKVLPSIFKNVFNVPVSLQIPVQTEIKPIIVSKDSKATNKTKNVSSQLSENSAVIRYQLSNISFIDNGWTQLPIQKVFRKINVYRMHPARPQFNWFERNSDKGNIYYNTGKLLASIDEIGHGRWFYKNGNIALDFYDTEDLNAKKRIVIYSSGELDRGRPKPVTILGSFDYCGNGIILDHSGNIRMKYNQTEGLLLDKKIGPHSHWKWHALNEPPTFQQIWVEPRDKHPDPKIQKINIVDENKKKPNRTDVERAAIELENSAQEQHLAKGQKFVPFAIRMKALKINENFTLRVLDQANIYVIFRDGAMKLKLNLGLMLDPTEIVDIKSLEVKPDGFESYLEQFPAPTDSISHLQCKIEKAKKFAHACLSREHQLLRPTCPADSTEQLTAAISRPLRVGPHLSTGLRTLPIQNALKLWKY